MEKKRPKILVIGSINMDLVLETPQLPAAGETLIGEKYQYVSGGKGSNQAVASARLGAETTFMGKVGDDNHGRRLMKSLSGEGVNIDSMKISPDKKTGLAVIMVDQQGENRILVYPGANLDIQKNELKNVFDGSYQAVILQLEIAREIVSASCLWANELGIPVILDAGPAQKFVLEIDEQLEILSPNETEASFLTGVKVKDNASAKKAAQILAKKIQTRHIVIKMGARGAFLYNENTSKHFPGHEVDNVVDTTAAGDAFTAAMTYKYIQKKDIAKAIQFANKAGALTVTKMGAHPSLPEIEEINKF